MTKRSLLIFAIANTLIVALIASYLTTKWHKHKEHDHDHAHHSSSVEKEGGFHYWLHTQLILTAEQDAALRPTEEEFEKKSSEIRKSIEEASLSLAQAIQSGDPNHPKIESSLSEITSQQSRLKKLMLDHFFAMKNHLDPEQAEKVRKWVYDSLTSNSVSRH